MYFRHTNCWSNLTHSRRLSLTGSESQNFTTAVAFSEYIQYIAVKFQKSETDFHLENRVEDDLGNSDFQLLKTVQKQQQQLQQFLH